MHITAPSDSISKITNESLYQSVLVAGEPKLIEFEKEVIWVKQSESTLNYYHGQQLLKTGTCLVDLAAYLSSIDIAFARSAAHKFKIDENSSLILQLETTVHLIPCVENVEAKRNNVMRGHDRWQDLLEISNTYRYKSVDSLGNAIYPTLNRVQIAKGVTWSSKNSVEFNYAILMEFKEKWGK